jgi:hypothetical protein
MKKIKIKRANTPKAFMSRWRWGWQLDYLDELRQQAKWDAEKCKY